MRARPPPPAWLGRSASRLLSAPRRYVSRRQDKGITHGRIFSILPFPMRFRVYPLRYRGRRLAWREVINGPTYVADLHTHEVKAGEERCTVATLLPDDPASELRLPLPYEPLLAGI